MLPNDFLFQIIKRREIPLANFLGYLLDNKGSHKLSPPLLQVISDKIINDQLKVQFSDFDPFLLASSIDEGYIVNLEEPTDINSGNKRIDILVHSGNEIHKDHRWAIIIELKVDHDFKNNISEYWYSVDWVPEEQKIGFVISPKKLHVPTNRYHNITFQELITLIDSISEYKDNEILNIFSNYLMVVLNNDREEGTVESQYLKFINYFYLRKTSGKIKSGEFTNYFWGNQRNLNDLFIQYKINLQDLIKGSEELVISPNFKRRKQFSELSKIAEGIFNKLNFKIEKEKITQTQLFSFLYKIYEEKYLPLEIEFSKQLYTYIFEFVKNVIERNYNEASFEDIDSSSCLLYKDTFKEFLCIYLKIEIDYSITIKILCENRYRDYVLDQIASDDNMNTLIAEGGFFLVKGWYHNEYRQISHLKDRDKIEYSEVIEKTYVASKSLLDRITIEIDSVNKIMAFVYLKTMEHHEDSVKEHYDNYFDKHEDLFDDYI